MNDINQRMKLIVEDSGLSKTAFAKKVNVSQQYISKIVSTGEPSELFKTSVCREFNINKEWLESGKGDMYINLDATDILFSHVGELLGHSSPKKRAVLSALIEMAYHVPEEKWNYIFEQFQNCYKESLEDNKKKDG